MSKEKSISDSFSDSISGQAGDTMSKYDALWAWIRENGTDSFNLTFVEI